MVLQRLVLCLSMAWLIMSVAQTAEVADETATDEDLLEFLGTLDDELDEWNEFFDMAAAGVPPEYEEAVDDQADE
jgi:hypothetical protein